jgi:biotin--protein ligase
VRIKWPNDIYSGGLKIGGALIHTSWKGDRFGVTCGIGLNVANREPTTCLEAILEGQVGGKAVGRAARCGELVGRVGGWVAGSARERVDG